jgi:hypothetical protein
METHQAKRIRTQTNVIDAVVGRRYHVIVHSTHFGDAEYDATLDSIGTLDPDPIADPFDPKPAARRTFDFLGFRDARGTNNRQPFSGGIGARDFTITSMREI